MGARREHPVGIRTRRLTPGGQIAGDLVAAGVEEVDPQAPAGLKPPHEEEHTPPERLECLEVRMVQHGAHLRADGGIDL
jgi:hypothetical protein